MLTLTMNYMVGLSGLEPLTSRLSGVRSNQLSYRPVLYVGHRHLPRQGCVSLTRYTSV